MRYTNLANKHTLLWGWFWLGLLLWLGAPSGRAAQVTLAWDASSDSSVVSYNVYFGTASHTYTAMVAAGDATSVVVSNLQAGTTYFFAATAVNIVGLESDYSDEIAYTVPTGATANQTPTITLLGNRSIAVNSSTPTLAVTISDPETAASALTLSASSSVPSLVGASDIVLGGNGSNRTLVVTPEKDQTGSTTITLSVSDGTNQATSSFVLTVTNQDSQSSSNGPSLDPPAAGFSACAASFYGLFHETNQVALNRSGSFAITTSKRSTYSGRLLLGSQRYGFSGKLGTNGLGTNSLRSGTNLFTLTFQLNTATDTNSVSGQLTANGWEARLAGDHYIFNAKTNPAPQAGSYTWVLPGGTNSDTPAGYSIGTIKVSPAGQAVLSGTLADGTKLSQSAYLSPEGLWPFFASLYSGKGMTLGWLAFTNRADSSLYDPAGTLNWTKAAGSKTKAYLDGFTLEADSFGSAYVAPTAKGVNQMFGLSSAQVQIDLQTLDTNLNCSFNLSAAGKVTNALPAGFKLSFTSKSGAFQGSVLDPVTHKALPYCGVLLQNQNLGFGFLLRSNLSSATLITQ